MHKIKCSVESCSYNQDNCCCANIVNVGGKGSTDNCDTCCGTFLNSLGYSNLAQYTENRGGVDAILCRVSTCAYHSDEHCTLQEIEVGNEKGMDAEIYTQTDCLSFRKK